jgi:hypothetical protein
MIALIEIGRSPDVHEASNIEPKRKRGVGKHKVHGILSMLCFVG